MGQGRPRTFDKILCKTCIQKRKPFLNDQWVHYRLPKQCHTGKTFIQLEPLEFIERISRFIPYPRRHRRHYHGAFAPNSSLRKHLAANAQKRLDATSNVIQRTIEKVTK